MYCQMDLQTDRWKDVHIETQNESQTDRQKEKKDRDTDRQKNKKQVAVWGIKKRWREDILKFMESRFLLTFHDHPYLSSILCHKIK